MQPGQYIVIKVADIEERIKQAEKGKELQIKNSHIYTAFESIMITLQSLLTNPTDLYGVVELVYNDGTFDGLCNENRQQEYLNNLEL